MEKQNPAGALAWRRELGGAGGGWGAPCWEVWVAGVGVPCGEVRPSGGPLLPSSTLLNPFSGGFLSSDIAAHSSEQLSCDKGYPLWEGHLWMQPRPPEPPEPPEPGLAAARLVPAGSTALGRGGWGEMTGKTAGGRGQAGRRPRGSKNPRFGDVGSGVHSAACVLGIREKQGTWTSVSCAGGAPR